MSSENNLGLNRSRKNSRQDLLEKELVLAILEKTGKFGRSIEDSLKIEEVD